VLGEGDAAGIVPPAKATQSLPLYVPDVYVPVETVPEHCDTVGVPEMCKPDGRLSVKAALVNAEAV
jgi:hypothetical protein